MIIEMIEVLRFGGNEFEMEAVVDMVKSDPRDNVVL